MSTKATPSPGLSPVASPSSFDESQLPKGQCRYILLLPEVKGQRCACVNFTHHKGMPAATCDCGHMACFHLKEAEPPSDHKREVELLRQKLELMEEQIAREKEDEAARGLLARVIELEETFDKKSEEVSDQVKNMYRNLTRSWNSITETERRLGGVDQRLQQHDAHFLGVDGELQRLGERQLDFVEEEIRLDLRIEALEEAVEDDPELLSLGDVRGTGSRRPSRGNNTHSGNASPAAQVRRRRRSSLHRSLAAINTAGALPSPGVPTPVPFRAGPPPTPTSAPSGIWTVHVSLLPSARIGMPFERNTNAYQRCLSRGLHQMVAVSGPSSRAFEQAVSAAFGRLLRGRPWMPLQAQLCDAEKLKGLPMLRPLDATLLHEVEAGAKEFDADFLRTHCAVCDASGKMDSLYIAMRHDTLSWPGVRAAPVFMPGLEAAWTYDPLLDKAVSEQQQQAAADGGGSAVIDDDNLPAAGEVLPMSAAVKRSASEISRAGSFSAMTADTPPTPSSLAAASSSVSGGGSVDSAADGASRVKRSCPVPAAIVAMKRRVETV